LTAYAFIASDVERDGLNS